MGIASRRRERRASRGVLLEGDQGAKGSQEVKKTVSTVNSPAKPTAGSKK